MVAALITLALFSGPAQAHSSDEPSFAPACHAASATSTSFEDMVQALEEGSGWTCDNTGWRADRPVAWLEFDAESWIGEERPRFFFSRIARFEAISFAALDADGTLRTVRFKERDGRLACEAVNEIQSLFRELEYSKTAIDTLNAEKGGFADPVTTK